MALKDVTLSLEDGGCTAFVGPSGGGKCTIARLIVRFWDVTSGEIMIGGINVSDIPLDMLADTVSFVSQNTFLFNCSLMENVQLGNPDATDAMVYAAAKAAS